MGGALIEFAPGLGRPLADILRAAYDRAQCFPIDCSALLLKIVNRVADARRGLTICFRRGVAGSRSGVVTCRRMFRSAALI